MEHEVLFLMVETAALPRQRKSGYSLPDVTGKKGLDMTSIAYKFGDFMVRVVFLALFGVWYE